MSVRKTATLVLWSGSYPYDVAHEQNFLDGEVTALAAEFEHVVLLPGIIGGRRLPTPAGVRVDESYAREMKGLSRTATVLRTLQPVLAEELLRRPPTTLAAAKRLAAYVGAAEQTRRWAIAFCRRERLDPSAVLFYSYWWTAATLGFGLAKEALPGATVVTRAHGYDLYEERHVPAYIPCREPSLRRLDALFPCSDAGVRYVTSRYRARPPIVECARLGVPPSTERSAPSTDGVLRVVSCSFLVEVKRLDRLIAGLAAAGAGRPTQRIEWTHFGSGRLHDDLARRMTSLPPNVTGRLAGHVTREELFRAYAENPVDVFVNVSESEGIPVSIMEAISRSIPVVATRVGGNPEIVTSEDGVLIDPAAPPDAVAAALLGFVDDRARALELRRGSESVFRTRYDSSRNFPAFARRLRALVGGRARQPIAPPAASTG
jgi:colanic acid/amylovoran biosynthesis glycosyltransferase